ncbi:interleukin-21 receptor [Limosa lapponica baueri]|uniref:Interleukin-21 receptor n=1 Tax=Limosa lapponica baueri TaxID=1758121 RepID=A0A2I0U0K1_LIMLA|nr:interleukin-21 receptor [Limosa lapponica baueri]
MRSEAKRQLSMNSLRIRAMRAMNPSGFQLQDCRLSKQRVAVRTRSALAVVALTLALLALATCHENLTCFVDYVQTLSCILRNDLGASSYNLTATWAPEQEPENTMAACHLRQFSRNTSHTAYMCTVDMTVLLADFKVQVDVTETGDRQHVISKGFCMAENTVTQTAGMGWLLLFGVVAIAASITTFLAKQRSLWKKIACIPDPAPFFKPLYLVHNGDFKKWVGASHTKMTFDFFEWGLVLPEVLEVYTMRPSNSTSQEELHELRKDLPCKPCVSCLTAPGQDSQSLLSSVNSSSGTRDRSYGHLSIDTVTVADEFTPCNCQCNCNRVYRGHEHTSEEDTAGETGYPKVNIDDEDRKISSDLHLADLSTQDKILASGSVSTDHLRSTSVLAHQQVERTLEGGMGSILEALCLQPNQWDLENPGSLPSPDGESVSYSEGSCDFFPHIARPGDSYPMICVDLDTIDSGFVDSDCGSPVDCEFEQNNQTNCGSIPLEREGEDFPRSYVKQWVSCRSESPANETQTD